MSVSMNYKDNEGNLHHHPLAGQREFKQYWLPLARKLGLDYVSRFTWTGINVTKDNALIIVDELTMIYETVLSSNSTDYPFYMARNIEIVVSALHRI